MRSSSRTALEVHSTSSCFKDPQQAPATSPSSLLGPIIRTKRFPQKIQKPVRGGNGSAAPLGRTSLINSKAATGPPSSFVQASMYSFLHRPLGWLSSPMTSRSNFTCVQCTLPEGGRKSTRRCRTESRRWPVESDITAWMPAQLSCFVTSSVFSGIRISAKMPDGACKRRGPEPDGCSSSVVPIGSSRFSKLQTPTYCAVCCTEAACSSSGGKRLMRDGGPTA